MVDRTAWGLWTVEAPTVYLNVAKWGKHLAIDGNDQISAWNYYMSDDVAMSWLEASKFFNTISDIAIAR